MTSMLRYVATGVVLVVALLFVRSQYMGYVTDPWTRDAQVRAIVVQVAPRVSVRVIGRPSGRRTTSWRVPSDRRMDTTWLYRS